MEGQHGLNVLQLSAMYAISLLAEAVGHSVQLKLSMTATALRQVIFGSLFFSFFFSTGAAVLNHRKALKSKILAFNITCAMSAILSGDAKTLFSPEDTVSCCDGFRCNFSMGCDGGQPSGAWNWFMKTGHL